MTISTDAARVTHVANGSTVLFSFAPIEQLTAANVLVTTVATSGVETVQTLGIDYTLTSAGVLFSAPPANNVRVVIQRIVPLLQPDIYTTNAPFPAAVTEKRLDEIVKGLQQISDVVQSRAIVLPLGDAGSSSTVIPTAATRAGRFLGFNAAGDPIAIGSPNSPLGAVARTGDTMLGPLELAGPPTVPLHAATKAYVDTEVATRVPLAGNVTVTGWLGVANATAGTHAVNRDTGDARYARLAAANTFAAPNTFNDFITLHADPTAALHAVPKQYVDGEVTAPVTASGSAVDFVSLPSWANVIRIRLWNVSFPSGAFVRLRIGSGSFATSGYSGTGHNIGVGSNMSAVTTDALLWNNSQAGLTDLSGVGTLTRDQSNDWLWASICSGPSLPQLSIGVGRIALAGTLDRISVQLSSGSFSGGSIIVECRR